jgi:hypothetical protein
MYQGPSARSSKPALAQRTAERDVAWRDNVVLCTTQ